MGRESERQLHQADTDESQSQRRSSRPQFHYFYGSTTQSASPTPTTTATATATTSTIKPRRINQYQLTEDHGNQQEQDSLVGEELVSTDNEADLLPGEYQGLLGSDGPTGPGGTKKQNGYQGTRRNCSSNSGNKNGNGNSNENGNSRKTSYYIICNILVFVLIAGTMSTLVVLLFPHSSDPEPQRQTFILPYESVVRADFGDPPEGFLNVDLFHPALISSTTAGASQKTFIFPFPTGAFWTNLVVVSPIGDMSYPIAVYPYAFRWSSNSLEVSYPGRHRVTDAHTITDAFAPDLTLMTVEEISKRHVTAFDPLSVTLRFASSVNSKWETALVQGSPYVTSQYVKETPILKPLSIFSMVQCPGDDEENFSDIVENDGGGTSSVKSDNFEGSRRQLFGVCSLDVSSCCSSCGRLALSQI
jgi:endoglucanase Acf2